MTPINQYAAMSGGAANEPNGSDSRKPWSTPLVIVSELQASENNNNGNNSDYTNASAVAYGNS